MQRIIQSTILSPSQREPQVRMKAISCRFKSCYLHHRKRYPMRGIPFFYYTSNVRVTGLEGDCAEDQWVTGLKYKSAKSAFIWCFAQRCNKNATSLFRAGSLIIDKTNVVVSQNILLIIVSDSSIIQSYKGVFVIEDIPEAKTAQDMIVDFCK